jgi:integrase
MEQAVTFLQGLDDRDSVHLAFRLMLLRGLRRGEVLGLTWADVDQIGRRLRVRQQVTALGGSVQLGPPKSRSSYRRVSLDQDTTNRLVVHRVAQAQRFFAAARAISPRVLVFCETDGQPLNPSTISRRFVHLVAALGLPVIRLHDLRHTSASLGLSAGESLKEISARLGHSGIEVTADLYAHVQQELAHESAERLARLLDVAARPVRRPDWRRRVAACRPVSSQGELTNDRTHTYLSQGRLRAPQGLYSSIQWPCTKGGIRHCGPHQKNHR